MAAVAEPATRLFFRRERFDDVASEIGPLLEAHYLEVAHYQDIDLDPDWNAYARADEAGRLRIYTAREGPELVGYAIYFVGPNVHYKSSLQAQQDVLFVRRLHRKGVAGKGLLDYSEMDLRLEGVQLVCQHIKAKNSTRLGRFLRLRGYELIDEIYGKRLDR